MKLAYAIVYCVGKVMNAGKLAYEVGILFTLTVLLHLIQLL